MTYDKDIIHIYIYSYVFMIMIMTMIMNNEYIEYHYFDSTLIMILMYVMRNE